MKKPIYFFISVLNLFASLLMIEAAYNRHLNIFQHTYDLGQGIFEVFLASVFILTSLTYFKKSYSNE